MPAGGDDEGTGRRRPGEPLAGLDGRVWWAGGAAPAAQAGGARASRGGRVRRSRRGRAAPRLPAAAAARGGARAQRLRGGAAPLAAGGAQRCARGPARRRAPPQAGDEPAGRGQAARARRAVDRVRGVRAVPLRAVRAAAAAPLALVVRLVPVQRGGVRRLRVVHVLREGAAVPLRRRRGGGARAVRVRAAVVVRGRAGAAAAVPLPVLAAARVRGGGRSGVRAALPRRLPLPRAARARPALQYYLVAHARGLRAAAAHALYKYLLARGPERAGGREAK